MKNRIAMTFLALAMMFTTSCASLGRFSPGYDSFDRGLALFNQGRFDAAIPYFEDATHENPEFGQAYFYLGRAYVSQSQWRRQSSLCAQRSGCRRARPNKRSWI